MPIWIDFESRSTCDLTVAGAYNYAQDASTQVLCMAYAHDDEEVQVWTPDQPFPLSVRQAVLRGERVYAHNAAFERLIWTYVLWSDHNAPVPALEQFYCTAAQARSNCAPGSLEDVGRFAGASMRKDHKGAALVRKCCIPPFRHTEQDLADLFGYCAQDVRAMRAISKALRPLSAEELSDYWTNERINDRGVLVDVELSKAAQTYAVEELDAIQQEVREVTDGEITSVRSPRMREWVRARVGPEARRLMTVHKDGEEKQSIDKTVRAALLILAEENPDEVPPDAATFGRRRSPSSSVWPRLRMSRITVCVARSCSLAALPQAGPVRMGCKSTTSHARSPKIRRPSVMRCAVDIRSFLRSASG
jgi:DNA polymerase